MKFKHYTIDDMRVIARERGGDCLSIEYKDIKTDLEWQCSKGHRWFKSPFSVLNQKSWCRKCYSDKIIETNKSIIFPKILNKIEEKGGQLIDSEYKGVSFKYTVVCGMGHTWKIRGSEILANNWCSSCKGCYGERACRVIFEKLISAEFPKAKPKFLRIGKNRQLELDGYNEYLKLAFEYNGKQHYKKGYLHKTEEDFKSQVNRDKLKIKLCKENNVTLINIVETDIGKGVGKLLRKIKRKLLNLKINIAPNICEVDISLRRIYDKNILKELKEIAENKEGKCLSTEYKGCNVSLKWLCKNNHIWEATPSAIKSGNWCNSCRKIPFSLLLEIINKRGGKLLTTEVAYYKNKNVSILIECAKGHKWESQGKSIKTGGWCIECHNINRHKPSSITIENLKNKAMGFGGECLSESYDFANIPLLWRCSEGHQWNAIAKKILQGTWCPECLEISRHVRKPYIFRTIHEMILLAKSKDGECLSSEYLGANKKLLWRCSKGHEWLARPASIIKGAWCVNCARSWRKNKTKYTMEDLENLIEIREGKYVLKDKNSLTDKIMWICKEGHIWENYIYFIRAGKWCPECKYTRDPNRRKKLEEIKSYFKNKQ